MPFTAHGLQLFLRAIGGEATGVRFSCAGARLNTVWPVDAGYPRTGDTDEANDGRGSEVLTWRVTVPKGSPWGTAPADEFEIVDRTGAIIYRDKLPLPFRVSATNPSILYLNIIIRSPR
jgi:hypothetical protein